MDLDEIFRRHGLLGAADSAINGNGKAGHSADGNGRFSSVGGHGIATSLHPAVAEGHVKEEDALRAIAEEVGLEYVDLTKVEPDLSLLAGFPPKADPPLVDLPDPTGGGATLRRDV